MNGCKSNDQLVERLTELAEKDLDMKNLIMNYVSGHCHYKMVLTGFFLDVARNGIHEGGADTQGETRGTYLVWTVRSRGRQ